MKISGRTVSHTVHFSPPWPVSRKIGLEKPIEGLLSERSEFRHSGFVRTDFPCEAGTAAAFFAYFLSL